MIISTDCGLSSNSPPTPRAGRASSVRWRISSPAARPAMVDTFSTKKRRAIMQSVRRELTAPEETLAQLLDKLGCDYTRNVKELPGKPDIVLGHARLVVFVHGCFWHGHSRCRKGRSLPKTNHRYWRDKIDRNKRRDQRVGRQLRHLGYSVFTIWACELRTKRLPARMVTRLEPTNGD